MSNHYFKALLLLLCASPIPVFGQITLKPAYVESGNVVEFPISLKMEIAFLDGSGRETANIPFAASSKEIPITQPHSAKLRLIFELTTEARGLISKSAKLSIALTNHGAFGSVSKGELRFREKDNYRDEIEIPITQSGEGDIKLVFRSIDSKKFDRNTDKIFEYKVNITAFYANLTLLSQNTISEKQRFVEKNADFIEMYRFFRGAGFNKVANVSAVKILLDNAERDISNCFDQLNTNPINQFRVFGLPKHRSLSATSDFYNRSLSNLRAEDNRYYNALSIGAVSSILEIEKAQEAYRKQFCILEGYDCVHLSSFETAIRNLIEDWASNESADTYCNVWIEIQDSRYYNKNTNRTEFEKATKKCDQGSFCDTVKSRYNKAKTVNALTQLLSNCRKNNCEDKICQEIEKKIPLADCQEKLERAKNELNPIVQRSLLEEIIQTAACINIAHEAKVLLGQVEELKISEGLDPIEVRDPVTGRRQLKYTVIFASGDSIVLHQIDSMPPPTFISSGELSEVWEVPDSIFHLFVNNPEKEYQLIFKSLSTGEETAPYTITKRKFKATIRELGDLLIIQLENGSAPYFAAFSGDGKPFSLKLNAPLDTLDKKELGEVLSGDFQIQIRDNNNKYGLEEPFQTHIEKKNQLALWMYLLGPVVLMLGFVIYRNLGEIER